MVSKKENPSGIEIVAYDEKWEKAFSLLENVLVNALGDLILCIEHVGSTAVKGLGAKPIIDLDIVIENDQLLPNIIQQLSRLGYIHEGDLGIKGRDAFARQDRFVPWSETGEQWIAHHLYVCSKDNEELKRHLAFRNFLREHPKVAAEYELLKRNLAKNAKTRAAYTEGKSAFVERILRSCDE